MIPPACGRGQAAEPRAHDRGPVDDPRRQAVAGPPGRRDLPSPPAPSLLVRLGRPARHGRGSELDRCGASVSRLIGVLCLLVDRGERRPVVGGGSRRRRSDEMGLTVSALRKWVRQDEINQNPAPRGPLTTDERAELARLRKELRRVEMERDFLKKAAAFFARET